MRGVIMPDGCKHSYLIRRLQCPECHHIHHELPDFIVPYKRYCASVIEAAIEGNINWLPCYDGTIQSFKNWFARFSARILLMFKLNTHDNGVQVIVSPLQKIKALSGLTAGWLMWAVVKVANGSDWIESTRLLC